MTRFKNHLNVSFFLAWLVGNAILYVGYYQSPADGSFTPFSIILFVLAAILILGTEVWYLRQKNCSLFNLFYNLLWIFGLFALLTLENKVPKSNALSKK